VPVDLSDRVGVQLVADAQLGYQHDRARVQRAKLDDAIQRLVKVDL
jgi:hypothetical protein